MTGTLLDTNVLVYAHDHRDETKRARALEVIAETDFVLSTQILQELFAALRGSLGLEHGLSASIVGEARDSAEAIIGSDADLVAEAIELAGRRSVSIWDALIVRAAARGGCDLVLSEDLTHGDRYDGVLIEDPFRIG